LSVLGVFAHRQPKAGIAHQRIGEGRAEAGDLLVEEPLASRDARHGGEYRFEILADCSSSAELSGEQRRLQRRVHQSDEVLDSCGTLPTKQLLQLGAGTVNDATLRHVGCAHDGALRVRHHTAARVRVVVTTPAGTGRHPIHQMGIHEFGAYGIAGIAERRE